MTVPEGLEEGLLKNLRIHAFLKEKFAKRKNIISEATLSQLTFDEMKRQAKNSPEIVFLNSMAELGFHKNKNYTWSDKVLLDVKMQAEDYCRFLFYFDDAFHSSISHLLKSPKDQQMYISVIKSNKKWPKAKKNYLTEIKALYKYVHYLSE